MEVGEATARCSRRVAPTRGGIQLTLALSETAPSFTLPGVDGRDHSLGDYDAAAVLVLVQWCNHCPYAQAWEGRLNAIQDDYAGRGVRIAAISSNDAAHHPEDSFEEMQRRADSQGFSFEYLYDESQSVARALGSQRTPEAYVFDATRRLVYHGAIDDSRDEASVTAHHLRDALDAVLDGRAPDVAETPAVGCTVKWRE
jgi:peroxiredoxin